MRNVSIAVTGACPLDAHKALAKRIQDIEIKYDRNPASVTNLAAATTVLTGTTPFKIYVFTLTSTMSSGTYAATFVEEAPNVEMAESLQPEEPQS